MSDRALEDFLEPGGGAMKRDVTHAILAHSLVTREGASPSRWAVFLHGVFGMGNNFRGFAKALANELDDWGFVLVDLRGHGASPKLDAPHTLVTAAADVARTIDSLGLGVEAIVGHSLGGKTTLAFVDAFPGRMKRAVVLDAMPGAHPREAATGVTRRVLAFLEAMPETFETRAFFFERAKAAGFPSAIVEWLAMNVRRSGEAYGLRLDLPAIRALLGDYYERDAWAVVEEEGAVDRLDIVIAGDSQHWAAEDRARADVAAARREGLTVSVVEGAGHWLHVDAPEATRAVVRAALV